jgi:hypothetical protein
MRRVCEAGAGSVLRQTSVAPYADVGIS